MAEPPSQTFAALRPNAPEPAPTSITTLSSNQVPLSSLSTLVPIIQALEQALQTLTACLTSTTTTSPPNVAHIGEIARSITEVASALEATRKIQ